MQVENLPIAKIDVSSPGWDDFVFTYPLEPGPVLDSIRSVGLQQPIVVHQEKRRLRIVIGVRRLFACRALEWREIPAIVVRDQTRERLLWLSLQEKVGSRSFNAMERSRVLQRFADLWQGDIEKLQKEICPLIGIPPTITAVETFLFLKEIPESQQAELAEGKLTPQHVELLRPLRPEDREIAADRLFGQHRVSLQEAREILDNAVSLAARNGKRVSEVFEQPEIKQIFVREDCTPRQRTSLLRTWLHEERFPRLSAVEKKFEELVTRMAAGRPLSVKPPRDFEGEELTVSFRARRPDEVDEMLDLLKVAKDEGTWQRLFSLLRGEEPEGKKDEEVF